MAVPLGAVASLLPFVSPGLALIAGMAVGLALGNPFARATRTLSRELLALSVIGLGADMDLGAILRTGAGGASYTALGIGFCLGFGSWLARSLRVGSVLGLLVTVGTAICGGSAIAAAAPVLRAKEHEVTVALAIVFLLNGAALLVFPPIGHAVGLDQEQFGTWAALAIHDTSSVVGASLAYGPRALEVATAMKLARALWIVPLTLGISVWGRRREGGASAAAPRVAAARPWFIAGFLGAAAVVTLLPALRPVGHVVSLLARQLMASTLFLIGAGLTRAALRTVGARPLLHGLGLWVAVAGLSLAGILVFG